MALAITDLESYRHRRETIREQNLRLEVTALAQAVADFTAKTEPHRRRLFSVAAEIGPQAMHSWSAVEYELRRLNAMVALTGDDAA